MVDYIIFFGILIAAAIAIMIYKPPPIEYTTNDLDKCESPIEKRVYRGLIQHGLHSTPQYPVGRYRIDLAFPGSMLAIECDGKAYHSTPEQKAHDRKRDKFLRDKGWKVLRFSGSKIHRDLPDVIRVIKSRL